MSAGAGRGPPPNDRHLRGIHGYKGRASRHRSNAILLICLYSRRQLSSMVRPSSAKVFGSCACLNITWQSESLPTRVHWCNCTTCRKLGGGPFIAFAAFKIEDVKINATGLIADPTKNISRDQRHFSTFESTKLAVRGACKGCHSPLTMVYYDQPDVLWMTVGSIDEHTIAEADRYVLKPTSHIFCEDKAGWYDVDKDGIPMWPGLPQDN